MDLKRFLRLREQAANARERKARAEGELAALEKRIAEEFGEGAGEATLRKLEREAIKEGKRAEEAAAAWEKEWGKELER